MGARGRGGGGGRGTEEQTRVAGLFAGAFGRRGHVAAALVFFAAAVGLAGAAGRVACLGVGQGLHAEVRVGVHALVPVVGGGGGAPAEGTLAVGRVCRFGRATDAAVKGPGDEATPGEHTETEEAERRAHADEDGAFGEIGVLHKRGVARVGDDERRREDVGKGGEWWRRAGGGVL